MTFVAGPRRSCIYFIGRFSLENAWAINEIIDLSRIPVNNGIKSRLGWTKYSDLYEIVHPSLDLISLCLLTGAECWKGLLKTRKAQKRWKPDVVLIIVLKSANELEACVTV